MKKSSNLSANKRRRTYVRLLGEVQHQLHSALKEEHEKRGLTQQGMADALEREKSFVSRKMNGLTNMTLETLADLAFALDRAIELNLRSRSAAAGANHPSSNSTSVGSGTSSIIVSGTFSQAVTRVQGYAPTIRITAPVKIKELEDAH